MGQAPGDDDDDFAEVKAALLTGGSRPPMGQLSPQPWMDWPQTRAVIAALTAGGAEVRFIGGCVRDALLHRPVKDIDIATPDPPERVIALLEAAGLKAVPTGLDHGTVTAVAEDAGVQRTFEVTTLRRDVRTDGRHAEVEWTADWVADAARRDFTINAMSATPGGAVYDYFDGLSHLHHGRVLFVGRPEARIREDTLRILRFFRFHARYGRATPDRDALKACQVLASGLDGLSGERVRQELLGILETPAATDVLLLMRGERVLDHVLPEASEFGRLRQVVFLETRGLRLDGLGPDPWRRLAAVLDGGGAGGPALAARVAARLKLSNRDAARLALLTDPAVRPEPGLGAVALQSLLRRTAKRLHDVGTARAWLRDRALILWAGQRALEGRPDSARSVAWTAVLEDLGTLAVPEFPLRGRDLLEAGAAPGPALGAVLADLEVWWEDKGFAPDRDELLAEGRRRLTL